MIIDCECCTVRGAACADCVVTFLTVPLHPDAVAGTCARVDLDHAEQRALGVLAGAGLVPPLRLVRAV